MSDIKLYGRVFFKASIEAITGLHIGGSAASLEIGGIDNPVIRDPLTNRPYIPGSSLRGKMRSQLEKMLGLSQNNKIGRDVRIHTCQEKSDYEECPVCQVFGVPGEVEASGPTLLVVRDVPLVEESAKKLDKAHTDVPFGELKTEVAIDRVTSAATPRNIERVPAGAVFAPAEMVFNIYRATDFERLELVLNGMQLVEDDYLGGAGSRGSGKVQFSGIKVTARSSDNYASEIEAGVYDSVQALADDFASLKAKLAAAIKAG